MSDPTPPPTDALFDWLTSRAGNLLAGAVAIVGPAISSMAFDHLGKPLVLLMVWIEFLGVVLLLLIYRKHRKDRSAEIDRLRGELEKLRRSSTRPASSDRTHVPATPPTGLEGLEDMELKILKYLAYHSAAREHQIAGEFSTLKAIELDYHLRRLKKASLIYEEYRRGLTLTDKGKDLAVRNSLHNASWK